MNGFSNRVLSLHWTVSAALMTGLLMTAEHQPQRYDDFSYLVLFGSLGAGAWDWVRARHNDDNDLVVATATIIVANTFAVAILVGAMTEGDGPRLATYQNLIEVFVAGFVYLLLALRRASSAARDGEADLQSRDVTTG